jgi:hypothetical protein
LGGALLIFGTGHAPKWLCFVFVFCLMAFDVYAANRGR